jgi:hypothetical protein
MTIRPLAAALLAFAALGIAACGDDAETPTAAGATSSEDATSSEETKTREAQVKFAECMRENGVNIPDPKPGEGLGIKVGPDSGIDPAEFEEASKACEQYREDIRPEMSEEEQAEFKERALEHARCMREKGIEDFPDPTFSADGGAQIQLGRRGERGGIDPEDPEFQAAQEACGDLRPNTEQQP